MVNGNGNSPTPLGPDPPRRLRRMIGAARGCSRARKRVARRKQFLDRLVERAFGLRTPLAPRPLPGLPHAKSLPRLQLVAQLAKRQCVRVREEASGNEAAKGHAPRASVTAAVASLTRPCRAPKDTSRPWTAGLASEFALSWRGSPEGRVRRIRDHVRHYPLGL